MLISKKINFDGTIIMMKWTLKVIICYVNWHYNYYLLNVYEINYFLGSRYLYLLVLYFFYYELYLTKDSNWKNKIENNNKKSWTVSL